MEYTFSRNITYCRKVLKIFRMLHYVYRFSQIDQFHVSEKRVADGVPLENLCPSFQKEMKMFCVCCVFCCCNEGICILLYLLYPMYLLLSAFTSSITPVPIFHPNSGHLGNFTQLLKYSRVNGH